MTKNSFNINKYNIKLNDTYKLILYGIIALCFILLLLKKNLNIFVEKLNLFILILSLIIIITKNWFVSILTSILLFLILNLFLNLNKNKKNNTYNTNNTNNTYNTNNTNKIESFSNNETTQIDNSDKLKDKLETKKDELMKKLESSNFLDTITKQMQDLQSSDKTKNTVDSLNDLLTQLDGGIKINESDKKETAKLNIDANEFKDEKKPDTMKKAQQDTYELINMVDSLKNTMETLAPVLSQGKEIMNMFENFKM